jgi:deoxyribonuclease V
MDTHMSADFYFFQRRGTFEVSGFGLRASGIMPSLTPEARSPGVDIRLSVAEAAALQQQLRPLVVRGDSLGDVVHVAGADVAFDLAAGVAFAAVIVFRFPSLEEVERSWICRPIAFPYVPGLLAFREAPPLADAFAGLHIRPDLLLADGQGYAHPRRCGFASHLGLALDLPTIGCAKSILIGRHRPLGRRRGAVAMLLDGGEVVGAAVRTREGVHPVYVSIGHRVCLDTAIRFVLACADGYRIPRPTRLADHLVAELKRGVS